MFMEILLHLIEKSGAYKATELNWTEMQRNEMKYDVRARRILV